jgi:hypothetical protein
MKTTAGYFISYFFDVCNLWAFAAVLQRVRFIFAID